MSSWAEQMLRLSHLILLVLDGVVVVACSILLTAAVEARVSAASCPNPRKLWVYSGSCRFGSLSSCTLSAALVGTSGQNVTCGNMQVRSWCHVKSRQSLVMLLPCQVMSKSCDVSCLWLWVIVLGSLESREGGKGQL